MYISSKVNELPSHPFMVKSKSAEGSYALAAYTIAVRFAREREINIPRRTRSVSPRRDHGRLGLPPLTEQPEQSSALAAYIVEDTNGIMNNNLVYIRCAKTQALNVLNI
jgi:hypothetical protein